MLHLTDRELIDAAIAAGKVRRIPAGIFALDYTKGISFAEAARAAAANRRRAGIAITAQAKSKASSEQVAALRAEGLTYDAIAARLGIVKSHAWRLAQRAGV